MMCIIIEGEKSTSLPNADLKNTFQSGICNSNGLVGRQWRRQVATTPDSLVAHVDEVIGVDEKPLLRC